MTLPQYQYPFFSIVMPTYNHEKFLSISVNSVLEQTFTNWELIIVDNNSTDNTLKVLDEFQDSRIRLLECENNGCIAKSRNLAINSATSEWLAFLDSDDCWTPKKLEIIHEHIDHDVDFLYHHLNFIDIYSHELKSRGIQSRKLNAPIVKDLILKGNTIATSSVVVRKQVIMDAGGMDERFDLIGLEDFNMWLKISLLTEKFKLIPEYLGSYRKHDSNHSSFEEFNPPIPAIAEFLYLLSPLERDELKKNFIYIKARTKFLNRDFRNLRIELLGIIRNGKLRQRIKSLVMLMALTVLSNH